MTDAPDPSAPATADAFVLFGATGDLAHKKLHPTLYQLAVADRMTLPVIGVARSSLTDDQFRAFAREAILDREGSAPDEALDALASRMSYVSGNYMEPVTYERLRERLGGARHPLFYLAIPPTMFEPVVDGLMRAGLHDRARVVVEKPFGRDLRSARELNASLHRAFDERAIYRIDHYLGKETIQNLLAFRFANAILEPIWDRRYISSVQVTMAESFGVEGRGVFYEEVGALRDVVQNHLLQVVAMLAMEPPVGTDADALRDEKVRVFRAMTPVDQDSLIRGQYDGYRDEAGVDPASDVETFVALRLAIESWRWSGVPFLVRAGKQLATTALEAVIEFREPPRLLFAELGTPSPHPNHLLLRLGGGNEGIELSLETKVPGDSMATRPVALAFRYGQEAGVRAEAYERLLVDAITGRQALFARQDGVEECWRVVEPALHAGGTAIPYRRGSWGPVEANQLMDAAELWHEPGDF
jgi:glucose-6-phosphate 1-dehydrogenase